MSIRVTEKWSERKLSDRTPWTASQVFEVTGISDINAALVAVDPTSGVRVRQKNDPWVPGSPLLCEGPAVTEHPSLQHWVIGCPFSVPSGGGFVTNPTSPLLAPTECISEEMEISEPTDFDLDDRAMKNANGDVFQGGTRSISLMCWTFVKNFPFWNEAWHDTYVGTVNQDVVVIAGVRYPSQHAKVLSVKPAANFTTASIFIPVAWKFAVVPDGLIGPYPWQQRFLNAGRQGWWNDSGTKRKNPFVSFDSRQWTEVSEPVLLDSSGLPLGSENTSVKVGALNATGATDAKAPVASPVPMSDGTRCYKYVAAPEGHSVYFKKCKLQDFTGIPL